jgi:hypothetical protein
LCGEIDRAIEGRADMMMKRVMSVIVFALSVVLLMGLNGCDRQVPPPKAVPELPKVPETAVGEMAGSAIQKAKGVETTLGDAGNRTAAIGEAGAP